MSNLTSSRKSLLPSWTNDLFDTGNFFGPRFLDFKNDFPSLEFARQMPSVNIHETDKEYKIEMAAPGLEKKDFKLELNNGILSISSEKKQESKEEKKNYSRREYSYTSFSRSFTLPDNCVAEKIDAKYENGILDITLPKKEVTISKPSREIKVS